MAMNKKPGRANEARYILVTRKTRLEELVERFNTWSQAAFYLEHNQVDAQDYLDEHTRYQSCITLAEHLLQAKGRFQKVERRFLPNYQFSSRDIVIVIGQDGLVANTLKYLQGQPVIGVNPDPERWDGPLLCFDMATLKEAVERTEQQDIDCSSITFAEAVTNDGQKMLAVNDLFIGPQSHASARYKLSWNQQTEFQSSSGIIVSTGFGSTGWFQSVLAGARAVTGAGAHAMASGFGWSDPVLQFAVREPFPSANSGTELAFGRIDQGNSLQLESLMPEKGVIFSDGIESDFMNFNAGVIARIQVSAQQGNLVTG